MTAHRQPCALAEESFCSSSALSIFPEFQRAQGAAINHAVARLGVAGVDSDNRTGAHRYDLPNSWMNRASGQP